LKNNRRLATFTCTLCVLQIWWLSPFTFPGALPSAQAVIHHRAAECGGQRHGGDRSRRCQPAGVRQSRPARSSDSSASPRRSFWTASESRSFARVSTTPWTRRASTRSSRLRRLPQSGHPSYAKIYKSNRSNPQRNKDRIQHGHNSPTPRTTPTCPPLNHPQSTSTISRPKLNSSK
jgi:hypothetical protein